MLAALMGEPFGLTPREIGRLTDRQITELYFHPRNEQTGAVEAQQYRPAEGSLEHELAMLGLMAGQLQLGPDEHRKLAEELKAKWQTRHPES